MSLKMSRRKFITSSVMSSAAVGLGMMKLPGKNQMVPANRIINVGVIGTGDRGAWLVYIIKNIPTLRVTACCDVLPAHLQDGLKEAAPGAKGYSDYRLMLEDKNLDAIVIASPLNLHYQMALDALAAGKHVFCEKTMTYSIEQALDLVKKVKQSAKVFQVGYQTRNNPLIQEIREMIQSGYCGRITHIRCNYHRNGDWRQPVPQPDLERLINWRMYWEYSGGLMAELCSHHIDVANWMLDSHPLKVTGFGGIDYWKDGRETFDNVNTIFEYPGGVKAIFTSITTNAHYGVTLQYMGTLGTIEIRNEEGQKSVFFAEPRLVAKEEETKTKTGSYEAVTGATFQTWKEGKPVDIKVDNQPEGDEQTSALAMLHFADCIQNNKIPVSNVESGRQATVSVHMANSAMRSGSIEIWKPEYSV
jgi:predicted dehydrogenase